LLGASVKEGANAIGAMVGARGCLVPVVPPQQNALADVYVVVIWQGVEARAEPAAESAIGRCAGAVNLGQGLRRGVSVRVMVPDLQKGA
jgi:type IV pilus assembly protein PilV